MRDHLARELAFPAKRHGVQSLSALYQTGLNLCASFSAVYKDSESAILLLSHSYYQDGPDNQGKYFNSCSPHVIFIPLTDMGMGPEDIKSSDMGISTEGTSASYQPKALLFVKPWKLRGWPQKLRLQQ